ncbi:hypothetical protein N7523_001037 [Penicillium sp. IBT 18751x]|nr:hypothetical protein N7523_001037 [Penicillium sp. IBT 18751x]
MEGNVPLYIPLAGFSQKETRPMDGSRGSREGAMSLFECSEVLRKDWSTGTWASAAGPEYFPSATWQREDGVGR